MFSASYGARVKRVDGFVQNDMQLGHKTSFSHNVSWNKTKRWLHNTMPIELTSKRLCRNIKAPLSFFAASGFRSQP